MPEKAQKDWFEFEKSVANIYRQLGADKVIQNYSLAGTQIDVYVEEKTKSGHTIKFYVECKSYKSFVGLQVIQEFVAISSFLKLTKQIDKAVLVSTNGFTTAAHAAAKQSDIELLTFADLQQKLISFPDKKPIEDININTNKKPAFFSKTIFVMMPFDSEMSDLYIYGIRGCAEKLGLKCVRVDEIEFNSEIITQIRDYIKKSEFLIGVMSKPNINVYYEVGLAHGMDKEVILLTNDSKSIPFDFNQLNHIVYSNIKDLEEKLTKRLKNK